MSRSTPVIAGLLVAVSMPAAVACEGLERARGVMGTMARVVVCGAADGDARAAEAAAAALDEIDAVDRAMSLYKPDSDLSRLNREGHAGPVALARELVDLIEESIDIAGETSGAFDVTTKPLMDHYGFYSALGFPRPDGGLQGALVSVGFEGLVVDRASSTVRFVKPGMGVDLGGIAKGHALDRAAEALRQRGISRALIDLGRNLMLIGHNPEHGAGFWPIGVAYPDGVSTRQIGVKLPGAVSTSSATGRTVVGPDGPIGHVLDPRRGAVSGPVLQVTVWSPSATRADALSTAMLVMGTDEAIHLLAVHDESAFRLVRTTGGATRWENLGVPHRFVVAISP